MGRVGPDGGGLQGLPTPCSSGRLASRCGRHSDSRSTCSCPPAPAFLGPATPPGAKYGSSLNNPYLVLRPEADTATPSTTTYAFDVPTPDTGWAFVLGDIDADQVRIAATDSRGRCWGGRDQQLVQGFFNYAGGADVPSWEPDLDPGGNACAVDTEGACGWFEPDVRLSCLTLTFTRRSASRLPDLVREPGPPSGRVGRRPLHRRQLPHGADDPDPPLAVRRGAGRREPTTDGSYYFGEFATQAGYVVRLDVPDLCRRRPRTEDGVEPRQRRLPGLAGRLHRPCDRPAADGWHGPGRGRPRRPGCR